MGGEKSKPEPPPPQKTVKGSNNYCKYKRNGKGILQNCKQIKKRFWKRDIKIRDE